MSTDIPAGVTPVVNDNGTEILVVDPAHLGEFIEQVTKAARPVMTKAELDTHHASAHGRDYRLSDDGYDDMEVAQRRGWTAIPSWGRDGWDLGNWPYAAIYTRERDGKFELQQVVEGDHDLYRFDSQADRDAAIDYLFLWYAADKWWAPLTWEQREQLDDGTLAVDDKYRGACQL